MTMMLAARIAAWREARGLTRKQVADACGVSEAAVYQWEYTDESGTTPHYRHLERFAELLGVTMQRFHGAVPKAKRKTA